MHPKPIADEDGVVSAVPAYRALFFFEPSDDVALNLAEWLEAVPRVLPGTFSVGYGSVSNRSGKRKKLVEADWRKVASAVGKEEGEGIVAFGQAPLDAPEFTLPFLQVHRDYEYAFAELCLDPADWAAPIVGTFRKALLQDGLTHGLEGLGFLPHPSATAHDRTLTLRTKARYRFAICGQASKLARAGAADVLEEYAEHTGITEQPGIAEIGWKTYLGAAFAERLDEAARSQLTPVPGIADVLELTIGDEPQWGDVNSGFDDGELRAIYQALSDIRCPRNFSHWDDVVDDSSDGMSILDSYLSWYE